MQKEIKDTLNLPKTDFPMQASLPKREPEFLENWKKEDLYHKLLEKNDGKQKFILHDGPPYANGDIHLGTALNKVLKDIIVRYKNMQGFNCPYVPGFDTHGLPTELKARKKAGVKNSSEIKDSELRGMCADFCLGYIDDQKEEFQRLGVVGDWENPYITLKKEYEAAQLDVFTEMVKKGYIYRDLRPVYWCYDCKTALAEAEIEYETDPVTTIYVKFLVNGSKNDNKVLAELDLSVPTYFVIWTTTAWTLPANVAICLGESFNYALVEANNERYFIAEDLVKKVMSDANIDDYKIVKTVKGAELEGILARHPFIDRDSEVILGSHVTLESGSGAVHTAPGHGVEDFDVCHNHYSHLPVIVPVDENGVFTEEAGCYAHQHISKCSATIVEDLEKSGALLAKADIEHEYPHCWRCKKPIIFRATKQWFCGVAKFKDEAIKEIENITFYPSWGKERLTNMVKERRDWCISRQRRWGVPIPIFYCDNCHEPLMEEFALKEARDLFLQEGSNAWYDKEAGEILPQGTKCKHCDHDKFTKELDIMDVWFDSGSSHEAVLRHREELLAPADVYLEGADQYRGWFQSSLLTSVAARNKAPYKSIITHGWVVDGQGKKMSKSLGNGIEPKQVVDKYGADILRLWVASSDYQSDIRISENILKQLTDAYRKIRNTAKYILGNISDFDYDKEKLDFSELLELDKYILHKLNETLEICYKSYDVYEFHRVYHTILNFCVVDLSNFYLDIVKDRLYVESKKSKTRLACQTTIYIILTNLAKIIAPIIPYTADEIWRSIGFDSNIVLADFDEIIKDNISSDFIKVWNDIITTRDTVKKALEEARAQKIIGSPLEASITLSVPSDMIKSINSFDSESLADIYIVSQVNVVEGILACNVEKAKGEKCQRCWKYHEHLENHKNPDVEEASVCKRCASVLAELNHD